MKKTICSIISMILSCVICIMSCMTNYSTTAVAIDIESLITDARTIIFQNEGGYYAFNANDGGAISAGGLQWHGTRALNLFKTIINSNSTSAYNILGSTLYNEICNSTDWSSRIPNGTESTLLKNLLKTNESIEAQNNLAYSDVKSYLTTGKNYGLTDPAVLVYFADLQNQRPLSAKNIVNAAKSVAGSASAITLSQIHSCALNDYVIGANFAKRRNNTYNFCSKLVVPDPNLPCKINDISGYGGPTEGYVHTPGANCGLYGTMTSNHPLKHVWGGVYRQDGTKAPGSSTTCDDYPNTTSYSLRGTFNNTIIFDDIPVGSYFFSISAEDSDGYSREVYHCNFTVGNPSITVTFNANGGSVSPTSKTYSIGGKYSDMPTPTRKGYIFDGWYSATNGGTKVSNGSALVSSSSHTLYAHWKDDMRKIYFNANGGICSTEYTTRRYGDKYGDIPVPSNSGYKFLGWYTAAQGGELRNSSSEVVEVNNYTLYAHWEKSEYTITFDGNGGTASSASKKITYGGTYGELPSGSKTGYTLKGWFTAKSGGTQVSSGTKVNTASNHTLYAQWTANQYNITLIYNDGTDKSETVKVTYDSAYGLKDPEREGYFFNGWFTAAIGGTQIATSAKVAVASDQTLYAHWSKDKLMLSFNPMGGTTDVTSKLLTYDNRYGILPEAKRTGYTFEGWYLDEAYTQPITETDVVKATGNQTAYAKWNIRQYIVTFDAGEGTPDVENKKVAFGKAYGALPDATWSDREFLGWYTDDDTEVTSDSIVELEEDTVLYAKWRLMGDVNVDGVFDIQDVIMVQDWLLAKPDATLTDWRAADACQDERIDVFDLCLLKRWLIERNGDG